MGNGDIAPPVRLETKRDMDGGLHFDSESITFSIVEKRNRIDDRISI